MENQHIIDISILLTQIEQIGIGELIDKHFRSEERASMRR